MKHWFTLIVCTGVMFLSSAVTASPKHAPLNTPDDTPEGTNAGPEGVNSKIARVVVYPHHAEVTREIRVGARAGENLVKFTGLPSIFETESLRATASDGARITGTETKTEFLKESLTEGIKTLDLKIQEMKDKRDGLERAAGRWTEERRFYTSILEQVSCDLNKELAAGRVSVPDWEKLLGFVRKGMETCDNAASAVGLELRDLTRELEVLTKEREQYVQNGPEEMKEVTVAFTADRAEEKTVNIHYMVPDVFWLPVHDVHLDRTAREVRITGYGYVVQWTGEAWEEVDLTLAMSRPDFELALPELKPMGVSLSQEDLVQLAKEIAALSAADRSKAREWSKARFKAQQERDRFRRNLERLMRSTEDQLKGLGLSRKVVEEALSRIVDRFAGVRYAIGRTEMIPCDASPRKVAIFTAGVPVELKYVATPALGDTVVLKGEIQNTTGYSLLEGNTYLFVDNAYVGSSKIQSTSPTEGLSFCFGPDDTLTVNRELVNRSVMGPENFRQSQVITYDYRITAENFNDSAATLEITDQVPVSSSKDIQVFFLETNQEKNLDVQTGMVGWTVEVQPGERKEITYSFSIECPVGRSVYWK